MRDTATTPTSSNAEIGIGSSKRVTKRQTLATVPSFDLNLAPAPNSTPGIGTTSLAPSTASFLDTLPGEHHLSPSISPPRAGFRNSSAAPPLPALDRISVLPRPIQSQPSFNTRSSISSRLTASHVAAPNAEHLAPNTIDSGLVRLVSPAVTSGTTPDSDSTIDPVPRSSISLPAQYELTNYVPPQPFHSSAYPPDKGTQLSQLSYSEAPQHQYTSHPTLIRRVCHPVNRVFEELPRPAPHSFELWNERFDYLNYDAHQDQDFPSQNQNLVRSTIMDPTGVEMLLKRYMTETCGILSVKDGEDENPWRTLIFPMIHEHPAVHHALSSMTAFHNSSESLELQRVGTYHFEEAITKLKEQLTHLTEFQPDVAIAAIIILAFAESWDRHVSTGKTHLRGARAIIGTNFELSLKNACKDPKKRVRINFLRNVWVYLDVLARLTPTDADQLDPSDEMIGDLYRPIRGQGDPQVDPLLGCAASLFPVIARVANLANRVRNEGSGHPEHRRVAAKLYRLLEHWQPDPIDEEIDDKSTNRDDVRDTAEAYRWATLLLLHQSVTELPSVSSQELGQECLNSIGKVPLSSRMVIVHVFPLMAASCETDSVRDRHWIRQRWGSMIARMKIGNVTKGYELVQEVWRRRDEHRRVLEQNNPHLYRTLPNAPTTDILSAAVPHTLDYQDQNLVGNRPAHKPPDVLCSIATGSKRAYDETISLIDRPPMPRSKRHTITSSAGYTQAVSESQIRDTDVRTPSPRDPLPIASRTYRAIMMRPPIEPFAQGPSFSHPHQGYLPAGSPAMPLHSAVAQTELLSDIYTVRGSLHWLQVMADNQWESKYCYFRCRRE